MESTEGRKEMIMALVATSFITSVFFLVDAVFKQKKNFCWYLCVFIFFLIINLMFPHPAFSAQLKYKTLTHVQKIDFCKKRDDSKANAERTYNDAKDRCWWLPDIDNRKIARHCFEVAYSSLNPGTPHSKLITMILIALGEYTCYCWDEWDYIETKLKWSKYHWEMYEFYCDVLEKG